MARTYALQPARVAVAEVCVEMNPCEKILAGMNPVIRAYHSDRWLPEEAPVVPEEDMYRFLIPALIALLIASLLIAFFVLSGWKRGCSAHTDLTPFTSE